MKLADAFAGIPLASKAQQNLVAMRYRQRAEGMFNVAVHQNKRCAYATPDDLRHAMREKAADLFRLRGKPLYEGAVTGLLRFADRCELDDDGLVVTPDWGDF